MSALAKKTGLLVLLERLIIFLLLNWLAYDSATLRVHSYEVELGNVNVIRFGSQDYFKIKRNKETFKK